MKPASFRYQRPESLDELLQLLDQYSDEAKIIAGGQSLVPMMNMRLARPDLLIDMNRIKELSYIKYEEERFIIGALTRQTELEQSELLLHHCPILPFAVHKIGHFAIRQRGTIGGSLAHADPSAELPVMAVLLDATLHITSMEGERCVQADQFFVTIYTTDLMPNEVIKAVELRPLEADEGWSYKDFARRTGDFAIVSVGCVLKLDENGRVSSLRMVIGGVDAVPYLLQDEIQEFAGREPDVAFIGELTETITGLLEPGSDIHASAEFRIDLLKVLIPDAIREAVGRIDLGRSGEYEQ